MNWAHQLLVKTSLTLKTTQITISQIETSSRRFLSSNRVGVTRIGRLQYLRTYPCLLANPDGSTFTIRYHEPRKIIKLPFDTTLCTEEERKRHLERRKPKTRVTFEEDAEEISFDSRKYLKLVKN